MKIDHESLGLTPPLAGGIQAPAEEIFSSEEAYPSAFGALLQMERAPEPDAWRRVLRLDAPPASQRAIAPPPAPAGADPLVPPRMQLRRLLHRHRASLDGAGSAPGRQDAVGAMLALLANFQDLDDAIVARQAAESRD